jgi:CBS domain-containing protein
MWDLAEREGVMNELVTKLLEEKNEAMEVVTPQTTIMDAIKRMNERRIGSVLVMDGKRLAGIFTERDVLTRVVPLRLDPTKTPVAEVMTRQPVIIPPTTTVQEAMMVVTDTRRRHLPVVLPDGQVLGMVSIGDLTRWVVKDQQRTIDDLFDYVRRA